jgi:uncharacterized protein involved in type VI secretion and phage assembly
VPQGGALVHGPHRNGLLVGLVTDLADPEKLGRVRVRYPTLDDRESDWLRMATPMAGSERGVFFRPEVDDEVLIGWEHNDPRRGYVLGAVWSSTDKPPADDGNADENNWRFIRSRSGHVIKLDDTSGAERIEIVDKDGKRQIVIDSAGDTLQITCSSGSIEIDAQAGDLKLSGQNVTVEASGSLELKASGTTTVKGSTVSLNP